MRNMFRPDPNRCGKNTEKENDRQVKKNKDIKEDEESLNGQEKKKKKKILAFYL